MNYLVTSLNTWETQRLRFIGAGPSFSRKLRDLDGARSSREPRARQFSQAEKSRRKNFEDYVGEYDWPRHVARDIDKYTVEGDRLMSDWRGTRESASPWEKIPFSRATMLVCGPSFEMSRVE